MKKYISIIILGLVILTIPNLSHAVVKKYMTTVKIPNLVSTGTVINNLAGFSYIIDHVYFDPNTSVTGKEFRLLCGLTYDTGDPIIYRGTGGVGLTVIDTFYRCNEANVYYQYQPTNPSSSLAITYYQCTTADECDAISGIPDDNPTTQALNIYKGVSLTAGFFGVGGFLSYSFLKKTRKRKTFRNE